MKRNIDVIGTIELAALPDYGIVDVPAKIDTGADNSAIWASDITATEESLSFCFFAPGSAFYTGKPITVHDFHTTRVRNSFGQHEHRYKVKLSLKIGQRAYKHWFTLADRSRNTYPVLLGKNFLKNRYVVDVSNKNLLSKRPGEVAQVAVLSHLPEVDQKFFDSLSPLQTHAANYKSMWYDNLWYKIAPYDVRVTEGPTGQDLADFDLVYIKNHQESVERAQALVQYLHYRATRFVGIEVLGGAACGKLSEGVRLAINGLPLPTTICASSPLLIEQFTELKSLLGLPFVLKETGSNRGKNNYLIRSEDDFNYVLTQAPADYIFLVQKYIANDGFLRVVVMGKRVVLAIKRTEHTQQDPLKDHLNNAPYVSHARLAPVDALPSVVHDIAVRSAIILNREVAGVDLIQDKKTKEWYILEVNNSPQLRSGPFANERASVLAAFIDQELTR